MELPALEARLPSARTTWATSCGWLVDSGSAGNSSKLFKTQIQITLYHPRSLKYHRHYTKTVPNGFERLRRQSLGHDVGILLTGRHMENAELAGLHPFTDEVDVKFDVLRALMMDRILGHVDNRYIVAERHGSLQDGEVEFAEELAEPYALSGGIGHRTVFRLYTGPGDGGLALGGPRDQGIAEEHAKFRCRASSLGAAGPIGVGVCRDVKGR